jgi:hypothetical protein
MFWPDHVLNLRLAGALSASNGHRFQAARHPISEVKERLFMRIHQAAAVLTLSFVLAGTGFAQSNTDQTGQSNVEQTRQTKKELKQQHKVDKARAKADKAQRKALDTDEQKKADKAKDKANREAEKAAEPQQ